MRIYLFLFLFFVTIFFLLLFLPSKREIISITKNSSSHLLDELEKVDKDCFDKYAWKKDKFFEPKRRLIIEGIIVDNNLRAYIAYASENKNHIHIHRLAVCPEWRREGLAKFLIKNALKSYNTCSLRVNATNEAAIQLYKSLGFKIKRKVLNFYEENEHAFFMIN